MTPSEDQLRALARSSPWLWRTLHFTYTDAHWELEAWVRRPGELLVRRERQKDIRVDDRSSRGGSRQLLRAVGASEDRSLRGAVPRGVRGVVRAGRTAPPRVPWPHEVTPSWRADGLVETRPSDLEVEYGDPMYQSYYWVAMLDPVELSHHTSLSGLREEPRLGRATWWARARAEEGYDPRCTCCALLWSFFSDREEAALDTEQPSWRPPPGTVYPEAYDVALDVETGVLVELSPVGASSASVGHRMQILDVDEMPGPPSRRS